MKFPSSTLRGLLFTAVLAISSRAIDASSVELSSMEISADPVIAELIIDNDDLLGMKMLHVPHSGSLLFRNIVRSILESTTWPLWKVPVSSLNEGDNWFERCQVELPLWKTER